MQTLINYINSVPQSSWNALFVYLAGGAGISVVLQVIKYVFKLHDDKKLLTVLLGILSFLPTAADALISSSNQSLVAVGQSSAYLMTFAVLMHRFAVSPIYSRLVVSLGSLMTDAHSYRQMTAPQPLAAVEVPAPEVAHTEFTL